MPPLLDLWRDRKDLGVKRLRQFGYDSRTNTDTGSSNEKFNFGFRLEIERC